MPGDTMVKFRRGEAPGLAEIKAAGPNAPRWRWTPGASQRARGLKAINGLRGLPGRAWSAADWSAKGFTCRPPNDVLTLTHDGPPLDQLAAARACQAIAKAAKGEGVDLAAPGKAGAPAPVMTARARTLDAWLNDFMAACEAGRVMRRHKGRLAPITAKTITGYRAALKPIRAGLGPDDPRLITRADVLAVLNALAADDPCTGAPGKHAMAVAAQRAFSRAMNWLRHEAPGAAAALPDPSAYSNLGLGQPEGRQRLALPEEADAMFTALSDPAALARELGLHRDDCPRPAPGAAAAWKAGLWCAQRGNDVVSFTDHAFASGRLMWRQSKTGSRVNLPLLDPLREAVQLARAARAGLAAVTPAMIEQSGGLLFWNAETGRPYRQTKRKTGEVYYRDLNACWTAARALAGRKIPSLIGDGRDPFGDPVPPLFFMDSRDTAVTRLFEAMSDQDGALASIAMWWGGDAASIENLLKVLKHYLVFNPRFADKAGDALRRHAQAVGFSI